MKKQNKLLYALGLFKNDGKFNCTISLDKSGFCQFENISGATNQKTTTRPDGTPRQYPPHPKLNMSLSCRLNRAGIVAYVVQDRNMPGVARYDCVVGFRLANGEDAATAADRDEYIGAATMDKNIRNSGPGWWGAWIKECDRVHDVVCKHFGIKEAAVFVHEKTGQLMCHVSIHDLNGQRIESCRWICGIGWVGW